MTGKIETDKFPYRFTHGNCESTGSLTRRQIAYIQAIIDNKTLAEPGVDERLAGGNAFPRRSNGDGGMTLRDFFANNAPITFEMALKAECDDKPFDELLPYEEDMVFLALAQMRYAYADAMLEVRAK